MATNQHNPKTDLLGTFFLFLLGYQVADKTYVSMLLDSEDTNVTITHF